VVSLFCIFIICFPIPGVNVSFLQIHLSVFHIKSVLVYFTTLYGYAFQFSKRMFPSIIDDYTLISRVYCSVSCHSLPECYTISFNRNCLRILLSLDCSRMLCVYPSCEFGFYTPVGSCCPVCRGIIINLL
jgi:hypothetical protein